MTWTVRLRRVAKVNPRTPEFDQLPNDATVTFLPLEAVWPGSSLDTSRLRSKGEVVSGYTRFRSGDILIPKITPTFQANRIVLARGLLGGVGAGTTELHVVRPGPQVDGRYLLYTLSSQPFLQEGEASMTGVAGQKRVPDDFVRDLPVLLRSVAEQQAIADYLDAETRRIDELIEAKRRMLALLRVRWEAELEGEIGGQWARAAILEGLDVRIPTGWRVDKLLHLLDPSIPLVYGILLTGPHVDGGVPFIGAGDVKAGRLSLVELPRTTEEVAAAYPRSRMRPGELVYAIRGSFGAIAQVPPELDGVNLSRDAARIAAAADVHPRWLMYALRSHVAQEQFLRREVGVAVTGINIGDLKQVRLPVPSLDQQEIIASVLDERSEGHNRLVACHEKQVQLLKDHHRALITAAVTGQFEIPKVAA